MADRNQEGLNNIIEAINNIVEPKISNSKFDRTFRAKVIEKTENEDYIVQINNINYTLKYAGKLEPNQIVRVKAPLNNFSDIYIESLPGSGGGSGSTDNYNDLINKPILETDISENLVPDKSELIKGTIKLHKISKTGDYSDLNNKPELNFVPETEKASANGVATLDSNKKVTNSQLPIATVETLGVVKAGANVIIADDGTLSAIGGAGGTVSDTLPIGSTVEWYSETIPENWLLCNGQAISRTEYAELFAFLGTEFGDGDGSTTFNLPDKRERFSLGKGGKEPYNQLGNTGGEEQHTLTLSEIPSHGHSSAVVNPNSAGFTAEDVGYTYTKSNNGVVIPLSNIVSRDTKGFISSTMENPQGGGEPHNNMPPYIVVNYIIKAKQTVATVATIIDNLNSTSTEDGLSANMGRQLNEELKNTNSNINSLETNLTNLNTKVDGLSTLEDLQAGDNVTITKSGSVYRISSQYPGRASKTALGLVKIGDNINVSDDGTISATLGTVNYNDLENKPTLNTNNSTAQTVNSSEEISGTINLHKVSKTGSYSDLLNKPSLDFIPTSQKGAANGVATLDSNKKVSSSELPSDLVYDSSYVHTDNNFTTTLKNKLDGIESGAQVNRIEKIQRNGTELTITNKTVNIAVPTSTSDLTNNSGFITNTINNLANYYLKTETYTQTEVNNLIGQIKTISIEVVDTLPTTGETNKIYFVPKTGETGDIYNEYIWINNSWELIGSTQVDLTGYATEDWVNSKIADFVTDTQVTQIVNNALSNYYTQVQVNNLLSTKANTTDIPTKVSELENDSGFTSNAGTVTSVAVRMNGQTKGTVTSSGTIDLGTVITSHQSLDGYVKTEDLATVATTGDYNDLENKPTMPTVNNGTLTIQKNGANVQTFTANQNTNVTANIEVPIKTSELTNDGDGTEGSSYITNTEFNSELDSKQDKITGAATSVISDNLTPRKALISDSLGKIYVSNTTLTELEYLSGLRSNVQTQIDNITASGGQANVIEVVQENGVPLEITNKTVNVLSPTNLLNGSAQGSLRTVGSKEEGTLYTMGRNSFAEGVDTKATNANCHAEGQSTLASGVVSHAEGIGTEAKGAYSHAEGYYTSTLGYASHVQGKYNLSYVSNDYAHIVGNGTSDTNRSNAHTLDWDGNAWFAGDVFVGGGNQSNGKKLAKEADLSSVAKSGSYNDLIDKPDIPSYSIATESTNGLMSSSDKIKLDGVATGAEVNVQSDWDISDTNSDAYIKNKPIIPVVVDNLTSTSSSDALSANQGRVLDTKVSVSSAPPDTSNIAKLWVDTSGEVPDLLYNNSDSGDWKSLLASIRESSLIDITSQCSFVNCTLIGGKIYADKIKGIVYIQVQLDIKTTSGWGNLIYIPLDYAIEPTIPAHAGALIAATEFWAYNTVNNVQVRGAYTSGTNIGIAGYYLMKR